MKDDFFIGWSEKTPKKYIDFSKKFVLGAISLALVIAVGFVFTQKAFPKVTFEFGTETILEGTLIYEPVPMLRTLHGKDIAGNPVFQHILLVGFGKIGALPTLQAIEAHNQIKLDGQSVQLGGSLIYYDGKTTLELTGGIASYIGNSDQQPYPELSFYDQAPNQTLQGEIVDPKCFFGVMNPGSGKPHKSCAARCISGGIPPIFASVEGDYFLVVGENGEALHKTILPFVADYLSVKGTTAKMDDWSVLYLNPSKDICRIGPKSLFQDIPLCAN